MMIPNRLSNIINCISINQQNKQVSKQSFKALRLYIVSKVTTFYIIFADKIKKHYRISSLIKFWKFHKTCLHITTTTTK